MLNFGKLSDKHLALTIRGVMANHGLPATIFGASVFDNVLKDDHPEYTVDSSPRGECNVLLSKPVEGIQISDFISLSDKIETEYRVITDAELEQREYLVVTYPDDKKMTLRITECNVYHALSTVYWFYTAIAV